MAYVQADRVQETTTTTGTGTVTLAGAVTGFRTFASQMSTSDTCYYAIVDTATGAWETGIGTLASSTTLARTTLLDSSTGSAISFAAGTKQVMMTMPAEAPNFYIGTNGGQQIVIFAGAGNHGMEIGRTDGVASTPYFDFHSSSTAADYDFRMINTGTATPGTNGGGYMEWLGKLIQLSAPTGQYPALTLKSSNSSGYYPAFFNFTRTGLADVATPDNASIGTFRFDGRDAANSYANFAEIEASIGTNASGGAPAFFTFRLASSGGGVGDVMQLAGSNKSMTMVGPIIAAAATTSIPSIRLQHGTAPSSPSNGDFWTTSGGGLFGRINGNTLNYTAVYFGSSAPSSPALQPVWFNTSDGGLYIYNSATWVDVGGGSILDDSNVSSSSVYSSTKTEATYAKIAGPTFTGQVNLVAGTTSIVPLDFATSGSLLTAPSRGAVEWTGDNMFVTADTTNGPGRQVNWMVQRKYLSSAASAISTGTDFFPSARPMMKSGQEYAFKMYLMFTKNTAGTVTFQLKNSGGNNFTFIDAEARLYLQTTGALAAVGDVQHVYAAGAATATLNATKSLTTSTNYVMIVEGRCVPSANTRLSIAPSAYGAGTITTIVGSMMWIADLGPATSSYGNLG